jgi:hypothetical protein
MSGTGKWAQPGVPHKGWVCVDIEDLGEPAETCEMCEVMEIRYVHHMEHDDYPEVLRCGCVCAGNMEQDRAAARAREATLRSIAERRKRWLGRHWRVSRKGNSWIKERGYHVTIFPRGAGYSLVVNTPTAQTVFGSRTYATEQAAQIAAFDAVIYLQGQP